jgi:hypothetical protein
MLRRPVHPGPAIERISRLQYGMKSEANYLTKPA